MMYMFCFRLSIKNHMIIDGMDMGGENNVHGENPENM